MKDVILASGVSRPRKPEKSSMGFAENFEVLQIRQRLLAHWSNHTSTIFCESTLIEEVLSSVSSMEELDGGFRKRNLRVVAREMRSVFDSIG